MQKIIECNKKALTVGKLIGLLTINTKTQDSRQAVKVLELTELELEGFLEEVEKVHAQLRFNKIVQEMKENDPNLYQILFDFLHKKLSLDELNDFLSLEGEARWAYIDSYKAR